MAIRVVCFDFQDTLAQYARSHYALYVDAATEHGVELAVDSFSGALAVTPETPLRRFRRKVSRSLPFGAVSPTPVITTRS